MSNKDTSFTSKPTAINCNGKMLDFEEARIMGILNITADSFYDGGKYNSIEQAILRTEQMIDEGAHLIDVGAFSSRPGAKLISQEEEVDRLLPILKELINEFPEVIFSIDTYRSEVALRCFHIGAGMINDISGGNFDEKMIEKIGNMDIAYVLMHMHGSPEVMQQDPIKENGQLIVKNFFLAKAERLMELGNLNIILDPGYGFGKTLKTNYELLKNQESLRVNNLPLLTAISRKSMINNVINTSASEALNGTTVLNLMALQNGANLLRVHDVKEARETIDLFNYYESV